VKVPPAASLVLADPAYSRLKDHLIRATGLAYYTDKDGDLAGRVAQRLAAVGGRDCASYLALLGDEVQGAAELDALIEDLTIGETFFFRHRELFDALRETVLPDLVERNRASRHLRIWSAGCATGAEAYSLSILLRRDLAPQLSGWDLSIVGTDINRRFLAHARAGAFEEWALRATPEEVKHACFVAEGRTWLIRPEFREGVSFQYHNLVTDHFPSRLNNLFALDLILCRNVTIYFNLEIVRRLLGHFHQSLVEGGWLLVGHSEPNVELFQAFRTVNARGAVLYQKSAQVAPSPAWSFVAAEPEGTAPAASAWPVWLPPVLPWVAAPVPTGPAAASGPAVQAPVPLEVATIRALADRGAWEEAAQCCEKALDKDRLNPVVHFYQALILEQQGRHAEAEQALRRTLYLERTFVLGHYYLGLLLQRQGALQRAARSFQNVLELLSRYDSALVFADGDGITAGELRKLTQMQLEVLEST
jgi:chemotaxis protein methyltransferase CheR